MLQRALDFNGFFGTVYANGTHGTNPPASRALLSLQWLAVHVLHTRQQNVLLCCTKHRFFFEGGHPVVYRQLFIVLIPSIHNICEDQMY